MPKYVRHQSVVSRYADEHTDGDHWLNQFQKTLEKGAVQPRSVDVSLFDQISNIMNGKSTSKHTSVAAAVEEMRERSGLVAYLNNVKTSEKEPSTDKTAAIKTAGDQNNAVHKKVDLTPMVVKKCPQIKSTLENYIRDTKGNLSIPAIIEKIRSIHQGDVSDAKDWEDDKLLLLVSKLNLNAKKNNPAVFEQFSNLGTNDNFDETDIDPSNTDAFHSLNPVKF